MDFLGSSSEEENGVTQVSKTSRNDMLELGNSLQQTNSGGILWIDNEGQRLIFTDIPEKPEKCFLEKVSLYPAHL